MYPKISIILPVYNVAPYLSRCLDSLVGQTLRDIEIIAINDCSSDDSLAILQAYATVDKRITILNNKINLKLAGTRNVGLEKAQGEYISFIDSDDYIELDFLEKLYLLAKCEDADIAKGIAWELPLKIIYNNNVQICESKYHFRFRLWTAIFRHTLLQQHDIRFMVDTIVFQMHAIYYANKIATRDDAIYYYCRRSDSNDSPVFSLDKWKSLNVRGADLVLDFINSVPIKEEDYLLIVNYLIFPLYFYGYNKLQAIEKASGFEMMKSVLFEFWERVKYRQSLVTAYEERKAYLEKSGGGYLAIATYSNRFTTNIGDAIQENAIYDAVKTVLPDAMITKIPRDYWRDSGFCALNLMQGWFGKERSIPVGAKLWLGTHFAKALKEVVKEDPPQDGDFGARDLDTFAIVPRAYLSRCYSLTLPRRTCLSKKGRVILTNIPIKWERFIPQELLDGCMRVTHHYEGPDMSAAARELIARYREEAALVITCKVHCAAPCVAMGIPTIAISESREGAARMSFLEDIIKVWSEQELCNGDVEWNPKVPDIETLKIRMLENLRLSILAAQGYAVDDTELKRVRQGIVNWND